MNNNTTNQKWWNALLTTLSNMNSRDLVTSAGVLGLGLIIAASIGAYSFYRVHTLGNTLSVTGSATQQVTADSAKWTIGVNRTASEAEVPAAEGKVTADAEKVVAFLKASGVAEDKIDVSTVYVDQIYNSDSNAPRNYTVHKDVTMRSTDPKAVEALSKNVGQLLAKGVMVSPQAPQYYVTNLPALRVSLIGKAVQDAKSRATEIAKATGQNVGALQSASGGVVQVMAQNSVDVSDYGSYDTSTIDKQVMVTTRAVFYVR